MKYILVLVLCTLATSKMSLQSAFGKSSIKNTTDTLFFNGLVFVFSSLLFCFELINCPIQVWIYAFFGAVSSVLFQFTYTKSLSIGNVSITVLIVNMSLVLNVLFSYLIYGDSISPVRFTGILLTIATFLLCTNFKGMRDSKAEKKWIFLSISAMLTNAVASLVQKMFGESTFCDFGRAYTASSYLIAAILSFVAYYIYKQKVQERTFKVGKSVILYTVGMGVILGVFVAINTYALSTIEGTFLYPTYSGGTIILSTLSGVLFFKDRLTVKQVLSILVGIVAVVLMNF